MKCSRLLGFYNYYCKTMTADRWSWKHILQSLSAAYSLFLIRFFGLWPYTIDSRTNHFRTNWFSKLHPILIGTIFLVTYTVIYRKLLPSMNIQWKSDAANVLMHIFGTLNAFSSPTTYICVYLQTQKVKSIIVRSQEFIIKSQRLLTENSMRTASALLLYLFKSFIIFICFTTLVCLKLFLSSPLMPTYVLSFVVLPILLIAAVPNLFFGAILIATVYFERINAKITEVIGIANVLALQKHKQFAQIHRYCELSDMLDELAVLHMELNRLTLDVCKVCNFYMTAYITWLTLNAIVQKFFVYTFITSGLKQLTFPTAVAVIGVLNIAFVWIELIMFAYLCFTIMNEVALNLLPNCQINSLKSINKIV